MCLIYGSGEWLDYRPGDDELSTGNVKVSGPQTNGDNKPLSGDDVLLTSPVCSLFEAKKEVCYNNKLIIIITHK